MNALFGLSKEKVVNKVVQIAINDIHPNPHQPRKDFNEYELLSLSESIRHNGILQPLTVRKVDDGYEIIAGERRLRAARLCELEYVPCIIIDVTERKSAILALVENIQRQDLCFFDEAAAIERLIDLYGMAQEDAAVKLGKAQSTIANKLRLLKLSEEEKSLIGEHSLTERHARALLKLPTGEQRIAAINRIAKFKLNVERSEMLIEEMLIAEKERESFKKRCVVFRDVRLFVNTINKAIETMQAAGIPAHSNKTQGEDYIEYVVRIPIDKK